MSSPTGSSPQGQFRELTSLVPWWRGGPCVRLWKIRRGNKPIPAQKPAIVRQGEYVSSEIENLLQERGVTTDGVIAAIQQFRVEPPSWRYGDSDTRFNVFHWPGAASDLREKLDNPAQVNQVTRPCPHDPFPLPSTTQHDCQ